MPIRLLDSETIAQIAAGEVVERPASVVKELVENALDAGAARISVEVQGGGISLIRVTDDGSGIPAGEVALAFERHATSKIGGTADLQSINSLGFRGEALPSIAVVARVEMLTRADADPAGTWVSLEGGAVGGRKSQSRPRGTTVTVRDLFRRVPARLKFLKSVSTESSHIANVVSQYALDFPGVAFNLSLDGKESLRTAGRGRLLDSIIDIYGAATAGKMLELRAGEWPAGKAANIQVTGMVGSPELSRGGRDALSFFVNRRWVNSRLLSYAVEEAYHGLLMTGRHPVAVLHIALPPAEVDVNIHPAKSEVKFRNEHDVFGAVQRVVRQALVAQSPVPRIEEVATAYRGTSLREQELFPSTGPMRITPPAEISQPMMLALPVLRVVGQVINNYIVAEGPDGLYLIDQHAAHERIRFDTLKEQRARRAVAVQGLLEPAAFEVTPRQDAILKSCYKELAGFGFALEPFGDRSYLVRTVPALLSGDSWPGALREMLDSLEGEPAGDRQDQILASIACHNVIRSGQALSDEEMRELVRQLEQTANPHTCPHGRPTMIHLTKARIEKEFGRG